MSQFSACQFLLGCLTHTNTVHPELQGLRFIYFIKASVSVFDSNSKPPHPRLFPRKLPQLGGCVAIPSWDVLPRKVTKYFWIPMFAWFCQKWGAGDPWTSHPVLKASCVYGVLKIFSWHSCTQRGYYGALTSRLQGSGNVKKNPQIRLKTQTSGSKPKRVHQHSPPTRCCCQTRLIVGIRAPELSP